MPASHLRLQAAALTQITEEAEPTPAPFNIEDYETSALKGSNIKKVAFSHVERASTRAPDVARRFSIGGIDTLGGSSKPAGEISMAPRRLSDGEFPAYSSPAVRRASLSGPPVDAPTPVPSSNRRLSLDGTSTALPVIPTQSEKKRGNKVTFQDGDFEAVDTGRDDAEQLERQSTAESQSQKSETTVETVSQEDVVIKPQTILTRVSKIKRRVVARKPTILGPGPGSYNPYFNTTLSTTRETGEVDQWSKTKTPRIKNFGQDTIGPGQYEVFSAPSHVPDLVTAVFKSRAQRFRNRLASQDATSKIGPGDYNVYAVAVKHQNGPWIANIQHTLSRLLEHAVQVKIKSPAQTMQKRVPRYFSKVQHKSMVCRFLSYVSNVLRETNFYSRSNQFQKEIVARTKKRQNPT